MAASRLGDREHCRAKGDEQEQDRQRRGTA
jgi:hypothetical protein